MFVYAIVIALLLDFVLGDPAWGWHPVRVLGRVIGTAEIVCREIPVGARAQGGIFLLINMIVLIVPLAFLLAIVSFSSVLLAVLEGVAIYFALGGTCLARDVSEVARALYRYGLGEGRARLRMLVSRDVDGMGEEDIASSAIETLAENFSDSACATLFYAALGGPILAWIHRVANTLDAMVGYRTEEYVDFGWASAKFDDIVNFLPARITALLTALVSQTVGGSARRVLDRAAEQGSALESPNSGYPIAAFAGALGVKLCGPARYFGELKEKPFIGEGPRPGVMDLMNALCLYWNVYALAAVLAVFLAGVIFS
ncbi:MAG: adenosylcobinamide-phosphate synthase CbiB [Synergistaceae bacterium]|nr:adenosylcobinamide-phosphate synthase CbiB [Synergistaceae bacterium]